MIRTNFICLIILTLTVSLIGEPTSFGQLKLKLKAKIPDLCFGCHDKIKVLATSDRKGMHPPFKEGKCTECHSPHASKHGYLIAGRGDVVCLKCHDKMKPILTKQFLHQPVRQGLCISCHNGHASDNKPLLRYPNGAELCYSCHEKLKKKTEKAGQNLHKPVREGKCLKCHDPHGSDHPYMLRESSASICLSCHDIKEENFQNSHMEYPVEKAGCLGCHDPHTSSEKGMFLSSIHKPVTEKKCNSCHTVLKDISRVDNNKVVVLTDDIPQLCYSCHNEEKEKFSSTLKHPPVERGECMRCHFPHGSRQASLVREKLDKLCLGCHIKEREALDLKYLHKPFKDAECTKCHNPHGSDNIAMVKKYDIELCETCHQRHAHPLGIKPPPEKGVSPREGSLVHLNSRGEVACISCHNPHASNVKRLLYYEWEGRGGILCTQCHDIQKMQMR